MGQELKTYTVQVTVEKIMTAFVEAKSEKEAEKRAWKWVNLQDQETDGETIKSVVVMVE